VGKKMAVQIIKKTAELEQSELEDLSSDGEEIV
jgi:hypothetical protein